MRDIPEGWASVSLEVLLPPGGLFDGPFGSNLKTSDYTSSGVRVIRLENLGHLQFIDKRVFISKEKYESLRRHAVAEGDVLFGSFVDGSVRVCLLPRLDTPAIAKADCYCIRPRPDLVDRGFLAFQLGSPVVHDALLENIHGATRPRITTKQLRSLSVCLCPLPEQKRVVAKIEELLTHANAARERLARVPAILKRLRQSILAAACSGRLTEDWRGERGLEDEWPVIELADAARDFSYGSASKSSTTGSVPVLRMGNIQDGRLDWGDLVYTSDRHEIAKYRLAAGDVLFNRTNSPELVGKTTVYRGERDAIYAGYLIRVRCADRLLPDYLSYCLNSAAGRDYCQQVKTDGVSQSNINAKKLAAFKFGLPTVDEQREIVRRVEGLFKLANAVEKRLFLAAVRTDRLVHAVLAKAFRGELVPTEADLARREGRDYEPAADLLERLRPVASARKPADGPIRLQSKRG
jgi:type I restriction enzyme S subunit